MIDLLWEVREKGIQDDGLFVRLDSWVIVELFPEIGSTRGAAEFCRCRCLDNEQFWYFSSEVCVTSGEEPSRRHLDIQLCLEFRTHWTCIFCSHQHIHDLWSPGSGWVYKIRRYRKRRDLRTESGGTPTYSAAPGQSQPTMETEKELLEEIRGRPECGVMEAKKEALKRKKPSSVLMPLRSLVRGRLENAPQI